MRAPAVSFAKRFAATALAALLTFTLLPANAFAEGEGGAVDAPTEESQEMSISQADEAAGVSTEADGSTSAASSAEAGTLAASLMGKPVSFINADVALDGEPVVGSFTVDGLTFAVTEGSNVQLVGVSPDWQQAAELQAGEGSPQPSMPASEAEGPDADSSALLLPETAACNGVEYSATSIAAYAFYLSDVTSVELPASIVDVDDRAFRSSDVASVEVAEGNPSYSSFDGALYDADTLSLLLIPEGKQGTVLLPKEAESVAPSVFSHCPLVTQIAVEEGSAAFASESGLLYDASLTTLLRVPAGATEITIREGCTTIAAGAMEACASLATINAPASVTSISPAMFASVPTVSLPAAALAEDAPQLTAMVALSSTDDDLPEVDPATMTANLPFGANSALWEDVGFRTCLSGEEDEAAVAGLQQASTLGAYNGYVPGDSTVYVRFVTNDENHGCLWGRPNYGVAETTGPIFMLSSDYVTTLTSYFTYSTQDYDTDKAVGYARIQTEVNNTSYDYVGYTVAEPGYKFAGWLQDGMVVESGSFTKEPAKRAEALPNPMNIYAIFAPRTYVVQLDFQDGRPVESIEGVYDQMLTLPDCARSGYVLSGWSMQSDSIDVYYPPGEPVPVADFVDFDGELAIPRLYAQWERADYDIGFDVDSEPGDEDCPGIEKPDETINVDDGPTVIEDPKRPGYVFQGWVIPSEDGTTVIDQDLVYQDEADGKWYVDASKLPDYATDGRVELTARWTSVISVDVPSAVTFYADVVTQGNESREGAVNSAFGQNKVASQSEVDLRIVGLESSAVETQGSSLGADSILKKASSATPLSSTQKLFSLYPTDEALTADKLQDPGAVSATKPADAVDFALDDILLEKSFAADKFTIPAGDTLNLGYRLNLSETGTELDYDKLSTLDEGQSASIANISYTFAKDALPVFWTFDDEGNMITLNRIKADARAIAEGDEALAAKYEDWLRADHRFYLRMFDKGVDEADAHDEEDSLVYSLRLIGVRHDKKAGTQEKAGLTFGFVNLLKDMYVMSMQGTNNAGWYQSHMRRAMNTTDGAILARFPSDVVACLESVEKPYVYAASQTNTNCLQSNDRVFLLSFAEVYGANDSGWYTDCAWLDKEGSQYAYYAMVNRGYGASKDNPLLKQRRLLADGTVSSACDRWWLRTPVPNGTSYVLMNNVGRDFMYYAGANNSTGVLPCFAF